MMMDPYKAGVGRVTASSVSVLPRYSPPTPGYCRTCRVKHPLSSLEQWIAIDDLHLLPITFIIVLLMPVQVPKTKSSIP